MAKKREENKDDDLASELAREVEEYIDNDAPPPQPEPEPVRAVPRREPQAPAVVAQAPAPTNDLGGIQNVFMRAQALQSELEEADALIARTQARREELRTEVGGLLEQAENVIGEFKSRFGGIMMTAAAPREKPTKPAARKPGRPPGGQVPIRQIILAYLKDKKKARSKDIHDHLKEHGRSSNPAVLAQLRDEGLIKHVERGVYSLA